MRADGGCSEREREREKFQEGIMQKARSIRIEGELHQWDDYT
jgi:hypothetical protein